MTIENYRTVVVHGAGGLGREIAWLVDECETAGALVHAVAFADDEPSLRGRFLNGLPVLSIDDALVHHPDSAAVIAIGSPVRRRIAAALLENKETEIISLAHPTVRMSKTVEMGKGTLVCAGTVLTTNIEIGDCVVINLKCTIGHDVVVGDYTTLAPGVHVSGCVRFGKGVVVGTGAVFLDGKKDKPLTIGDGAVIGAGACVVSDVPPGETWVGIPAKKIR